MSTPVSGAASYMELIPQVMAARQQSQRQEISIAVASKARDMLEIQGDTIVAMIDQVAAAMDGAGTILDVQR